MSKPPAKDGKSFLKTSGKLASKQPTKAPTALDTLLQQAVTYLKNKNHPPLDQVLAQAAKIAPEDPRVLHFQGLSAFEQHDSRTAIGFLNRALTMRPHDVALQHNTAAVLISLGQFEPATELLLQAIARKPDYAEAYHTLMPIYTFTADDPLIAQMEKGLKKPDLTPTEVSFYAFALARACDQAGLYDKAWVALERANAAMAHTFDADQQTSAVTAIKTHATQGKLDALAPYGHPSKAPIFIVGMPRSGTTLLESTIAAHPQIFGAGELTILGNIGRSLSQNLGATDALLGYGSALEKISPPHAFAAGLGYLNAARTKATGWFDHFVDKLPDNSFNLGLAAALLPNAKVVHIMRHPLDVMLSIYMQRFTSVKYSFRPQDILRHYHDYQSIMAHWRAHLPLDMIEIRYETLTEDVDQAQQHLWQHLGLTTQIGHVPQSGAKDAQRTASRFQVRQPVYQTSREKFRSYEAHMGEFIDGMGGMAAIEAEVAAQKERCWLRAKR